MKAKLLPVDRTFFIMLVVLISFGLLMVYEASAVYSDRAFGSKYHFSLLQAGWILIGSIGMFIFSRIDLEYLKKISPYLFLISIGFLLFILIPTIFAPTVYGARRWLVINPSPLPALPILGRISFQPSELVKLTGIIFLSAFLSSDNFLRKRQASQIFSFFVVFTLVCGLVLLEPNFTTTFVIATIFLGLFFLSDQNIWLFVLGGPIMAIAASLYAYSSEYRRARIHTLFNSENLDKAGAGYHIRQIMIALGSGGLWGLGLGKSRQKYDYLPEVSSDSIFAIVGEELGFIGTTLLILLYLGLIWKGLTIAQQAKDLFSKLLVSGSMVWIAVQTLINLGAMVRLIPVTGVPLPLVSYGGSSTIFIMCAMGLVLNVSRQTQHEKSKI